MENASKSQLKRLAVQNPDELKRKVWKSGDEAAWLADKIVTGSPDYCQSAAQLLRKYSTLEQQLAELLAAAKQTIEENWHLADGNNCTLKVLREAVYKIEGWK